MELFYSLSSSTDGIKGQRLDRSVAAHHLSTSEADPPTRNIRTHVKPTDMFEALRKLYILILSQ